jgi:hypothetical protein
MLLLRPKIEIWWCYAVAAVEKGTAAAVGAKKKRSLVAQHLVDEDG